MLEIDWVLDCDVAHYTQLGSAIILYRSSNLKVLGLKLKKWSNELTVII